MRPVITVLPAVLSLASPGSQDPARVPRRDRPENAIWLDSLDRTKANGAHRPDTLRTSFTSVVSATNDFTTNERLGLDPLQGG